jgi:hypothetical protein
VTDYESLDASSMAVGVGGKALFGDADIPNRYYAGFALEYTWGGGITPNDYYIGDGYYADATYKFSAVDFMGTFGYRWRFTSGMFVGFGVVGGVATTVEDYREMPERKDYDKKIYVIGMLDLSLGIEFR